MKFTIRKYSFGWQIWNTDQEPWGDDIIGESDRFFVVALFRFIKNYVKESFSRKGV